MGKVALMKDYQHFIAPAKSDPNFPAAYTRHLVTSLDELRTILREAPREVTAFDLETDGLNPEQNFIVGVSLCMDGRTAYYIPIQHATGVSLGRRALHWVHLFLLRSKLVLVYNLRFDFRFMEAAGFDMSEVVYRDVMVQTFLADTNVTDPTLKWAQQHFLGWKATTFAGVLGDNANFYHVDPIDACLAAGTEVETSDGEVRIEELQRRLLAGERLALVTPRGEQIPEAVVSRGVRECLELLLEDGSSLWVTPDHWFLVATPHSVQWQQARDMLPWSKLVTIATVRGMDCGSLDFWVTLDTIEILETLSVRVIRPGGSHPVYDVLMASGHVYTLAKGVVTHNCDYAAQDALGTWHLHRVTDRFYREGRLSADIDNRFLYPFMRMEAEATRIDIEELRSQELALSAAITKAEQKIYGYAGQVFNVASPAQRAEVLRSLGLDTGYRTEKTKEMQTGADQLAELKDAEGAWLHPIVPHLVDHAHASKKLSSIQALRKQAEVADGGRLRFSYRTARVPTGRLASAEDRGNSFFAKTNIQAQDKAKAIDYRCRPADEHSDPDMTILDWEFSVDPCFSDQVVEGFVRHPNLRHGFKPEPGHVWLSIDYAGQELRIATNYSREPVWLEAFASGTDLHTATSMAIFGVGDKNHRKMAKGANFSLLYRGTWMALHRATGMPQEQAEEVADLWWEKLSGLRNWELQHIRACRQAGMAQTYFGRQRRLEWFFANPSGSIRSYGARSAVNTVVQGAGADIIKSALIRCWPILRDNAEDIAFRSTVHDEINFTCRAERVQELLPQVLGAMALAVRGWPVPITVDFSIGTSWGWIFPWRFAPETGLVEPAYAT